MRGKRPGCAPSKPRRRRPCITAFSGPPCPDPQRDGPYKRVPERLCWVEPGGIESPESTPEKEREEKPEKS